MKRILALGLCLVVFFGLCGCGSVSGVEVKEVDSEIYSQKEIKKAVKAAKRYFFFNFSGGCELEEIYYAGDEATEEEQEYQAEDGNSNEIIVLTYRFYVEPDGGDGSFETDKTYSWRYVLERESSHSGWKVLTYGDC